MCVLCRLCAVVPHHLASGRQGRWRCWSCAHAPRATRTADLHNATSTLQPGTGGLGWHKLGHVGREHCGACAPVTLELALPPPARVPLTLPLLSIPWLLARPWPGATAPSACLCLLPALVFPRAHTHTPRVWHTITCTCACARACTHHMRPAWASRMPDLQCPHSIAIYHPSLLLATPCPQCVPGSWILDPGHVQPAEAVRGARAAVPRAVQQPVPAVLPRPHPAGEGGRRRAGAGRKAATQHGRGGGGHTTQAVGFKRTPARRTAICS